MEASRGVGRTTDTGFARYLRTGRRAAPLELKYNHNHDPANGRFTLGDGGGGGSAAARAAKVVRVPRRIAPPRAPALAEGPFRTAARRQEAVGGLAREVNALVAGRSDRVAIPLGGVAGDVTVRRVAGDVVDLDNHFFSAPGRLRVTPHHEEIVIALEPPTGKLGTRYASFPTHLRLFEAVTGRINYSIDRDLVPISPFLKVNPIRAGTYLGLDAKR